MKKAIELFARIGGTMIAVGLFLVPFWTPGLYVMTAGFSVLILAMVWTL